MTIAFYTLGCKVNQYETEYLKERFAAAGFAPVEAGQAADVFVVNSCTVTASGDRKTRQLLRRLARQAPGALLVLTGCMPQAFPAAAEQLPEARVVTGTRDRGKLVEYVRRALATGERIVDLASHRPGEAFEAMCTARFAGHTRAFVKIEDGCDRYCAYCIIPTARGPVRSRPPAALRAELAGLAAAGYREAVLVGINLSSYGKDCGLRLADAVETACSVDGIERVRLGSLEPDLLTREDLGRLQRLEKLCPQFHLSLQSGCDATLRRMNRRYDTAFYAGLVEQLRRAFPGCAVTTDLMVGFPGETEEEFAQSLAFAERIGFAQTHVFAYSARPGTRAAQLPGQVGRSVREARSRRMAELAGRSRNAFLQEQVGRTAPVLFEATVTEEGTEGHTPQGVPVFVRAEQPLTRRILPVRITGLRGGHCTGELA